MNDPERIQMLRSRTGRTASEIAALVGISDMAYFDLEFHDDELRSVPSLATVKQLASVFGVPTRRLFDDASEPPSGPRLSYTDLVTRARQRIASDGTQEKLEDAIGWYLDAFLRSEAAAMAEYPVEFLIELCQSLGIDWMDALP